MGCEICPRGCRYEAGTDQIVRNLAFIKGRNLEALLKSPTYEIAADLARAHHGKIDRLDMGHKLGKKKRVC
jgi:hypothetical protein